MENGAEKTFFSIGFNLLFSTYFKSPLRSPTFPFIRDNNFVGPLQITMAKCNSNMAVVAT